MTDNIHESKIVLYQFNQYCYNFILIGFEILFFHHNFSAIYSIITNNLSVIIIYHQKYLSVIVDYHR